MAKSCELCLALLAAGDHARAVQLFSLLQQWRGDDGEYWTGYQFVEQVLWPQERPTWTAAAVLLAADALIEYRGISIVYRGTPFNDGHGQYGAATEKVGLSTLCRGSLDFEESIFGRAASLLPTVVNTK